MAHISPAQLLFPAGVRGSSLPALIGVTTQPYNNYPKKTNANMSELAKVAALRKNNEERQKEILAKLGPLDESLEEISLSIPMSDGHSNAALIVRHKAKDNGSAPRPLIVICPGGGFTWTSPHQVARPSREFAREFDAVVVCHTYRTMPEHVFPVQFNDCMDTLKWLGENAKTELGADPEAGFVLVGFSAGGTLAAATVQRAHDEGMTPKLTGSFISIPMLFLEETVPEKHKSLWTARDDNRSDPAMPRDPLANVFSRVQADIKSPIFSPFNAKNPHVGLPRTYVQVGGKDLIRDDGIIYERCLRDNGVETRLDCFEDLSHQGWTNTATEEIHRELGEKALDAMRWLLRK